MHPWHDCYVDDALVEAAFPVIIEVPKGSTNKYELDKETGLLRLDRVLYSAVYYPADYGFIPRTFCDDGDPLDALVLSQEPVHPLTIVEARAIGVMRMRDEKGIDDKIVAVSVRDPAFAHYIDKGQLPPHMFLQIRRFFEDYKVLEHKQVVVEDLLGMDDAVRIIREALDLYRQLRRGELRETAARGPSTKPDPRPSKPEPPTAVSTREASMRQDFALRAAQPAQEPGLCRGDGPDAGAGHRRQHRHLQRRQRRDPQAAAVSVRRSGWSSSPASFPASGSISSGSRRRSSSSSRESNRSFQEVGAYRAGAVNLGTPDQPRRVNSAVVTSELMPVLGVAPIRGRQFTREDTLPGAEDVAVLSSEIWRSAFGGDESVVGRAVPIDGAPTRIVGIMPPGYDVHDERSQVWLPLTLDPGQSRRPRRSLPLSGRPAEGRRHAWRRRRSMLETHARSSGRSASQGTHVPNHEDHRLRFDGLQDDLVGGIRHGALGAAGRGRRSCCSSPAPTWRTCCSRAPSRGRGSSRSARRSAPAAGGCCGSS